MDYCGVPWTCGEVPARRGIEQKNMLTGPSGRLDLNPKSTIHGPEFFNGKRFRKSFFIMYEIDSLFEGIHYSSSLFRLRFEELCMDYFCIPWAAW